MLKLLRRLRYLLRQRQIDADLAEEMEFHRAEKQVRLERAGVDPREAAYASRRALGNVALAREQARGVWIWPWLGSVRQDLSYAARSLRRQPGFTLLACGTLAAAIGLNTSLLTIYSAFVWRPWPVPEADRVVNVTTGSGGNVSHAAFQHFARQSTTFEGLFVERRAGDHLIGVIGDDRLRATWVSSAYFATLRVPLLAGRGFSEEDDRPGAPAVAVVSFPAWHARFNADPAVVGRTIRIDDVPIAIVGVAPPGFTGTMPERVDLWLPMFTAQKLRPNERWVREELGAVSSPPARVAGVLALSGRLAPGATLAQARGELEALAARFDARPNGAGPRFQLADTAAYSARGREQITSLFLRMLAAVAAVLLLACANVGNLLLARGAARRREIVARLSLGATRVRIVRQLITENLALALLAGAAGTVLALHLPRVAVEAASGQPTALQLQPDLTVIAYTLSLCVLSCLLFGLAPALHATRVSMSAALKDDAAVPGLRLSLRNLLLSVQVALSVVLLVGAGLLVRGVQRGLALDHGFRIEGVTVLSFEAPGSVYDAARTRAFAGRLMDEVDALAASAPIALAHVAPFGSGNIKGSFRLPDSTADEFNAVYEVSPSYFSVLGIPLVAGRAFGSSDSGANAVIVNETLARRFGSAGAAVGQTITSSLNGGWNLPGTLRIVGVARDAAATPLGQVPPTIYQPVSGRSIPQVLIRDMPGAAQRIGSIVADIDPRVRVRSAPLSENVAGLLKDAQAAAAVATALGAAALALATIGMFGMFAVWVQQRTREIGIRMALGARGPQVVRLVLGSSATAIGIGLTIGLLASTVTSNLLRGALYGVSTLDPIAYGTVVLLLAFASLLATVVPARRASRVDPLVALRYE